MATKLFQHLAIENDKRTAAAKVIAETAKVFKGQDLFYGVSKNYQPIAENGDPLPDESKNMVTTVDQRLKWTERFVVEMIDHMAAKDKANQSASAEFLVKGKSLGKLAAPTLLALEKKLREIRAYYDSSPTLDLSLEWTPDSQRPGVSIHGPIKTYRTAKQTKAVVMAQATDKFPAQVEKVVEDVTIGTFFTKKESGALHPGVKARYLANIDTLIEAAKDARMRANQVDVESVKVGESIFNFIHEAPSK